MTKALKQAFVPVLTLAVCIAATVPTTSGEAPNGPLIQVDWLQERLTDPDLLILDASPRQMYSAKHIPGAISVDLMSWYGVHDTPVAEFDRVYQSWGISANKKVVMYDQGGTYLATRLFFSLYRHGFPLDRLFLLDGGLAKWQERGLATTPEASPVTPGSFVIQRMNDDEAGLPEVLVASGDPGVNALVEALGPDWHFGETVAFTRAGHLPNGILLPSADFYNADKTFKSPAEIRKMLDYLGIRPEQRIYTYCGGGVAASVPYFALKFLVNYPHVKLFTQSELGWLQDERELPYWTYDAPYLLRQASWLQTWAGQKIRMYTGARISIVDVRPTAAFNQGHVPFALNIPVDEFRSRLKDLASLAPQLGRAGVDVSHEAVVVSGSGITPDAALAFVVLQALGQKKVSLFVDSMEQWTQLGFPLKTDPTVIGPRTNVRDVSIPPTTYPATFRDDVIVADASSVKGLYPKFFIASGRHLPDDAPDGHVVHVPYTDLLQADGRPKAAKDIWNILVKAGVPRYAQLICVSDDPGEAAVNYFVLKLMGYPDVKLLAS